MPQEINFELSRRQKHLEQPINIGLRLINYTDKFLPIEIVDRESSQDQYTPKFSYIYIPKNERDELLEQIKKSKNVCGKISIKANLSNTFLSRYTVQHINITNEICNYIL